jgi:hypothetical protein
MVWSTYRREIEYPARAGLIEQYPPCSHPSNLPKELPESNRGMQHQSIEACFDTRAAEWQSPMNA